MPKSAQRLSEYHVTINAISIDATISVYAVTNTVWKEARAGVEAFEALFFDGWVYKKNDVKQRYRPRTRAGHSD